MNEPIRPKNSLILNSILGFGLLSVLAGIILILLLAQLPLGLFCFILGISVIYFTFERSIVKEKNEDLEFKDLDHTLALATLYSCLDSGF